MSAREAALRLAALKALKDRVDDAYTSARKAALAAMDPGDRKSAVLDDGTDIGTVSVTKPKLRAAVVDERAFLAWVKAEAPGEIVESVRETYRRHILGRVERYGNVVDTETGEILADGVELRPSEPYATCRQSDAQAAAVAAAYAAGGLEAILRGTPLFELAAADAEEGDVS